MRRRKIAARICAFALAASLVAFDAFPSLGAERPREPTPEDMQIFDAFPALGAEGAREPAAEDMQIMEYVTADEAARHPGPMDETARHSNPMDAAGKNQGPQDAAGDKPEDVPVPPTEKDQEAIPKGLEHKDWLVYMDGVLYTGYYMDASGIMYTVSSGTAKPAAGIMKKGISYYNCQNKKFMTLPKQALYVDGKVYSGYYIDQKNKMYYAKKGTGALKTGIVKAGAKYFNCNTGKLQKLAKQTLYLKGKAYSGYYMGRQKKIYHVKKGILTPVTGTLKAKTKYYDYRKSKTQKLSKQTLYVKGKPYTGYYLNSKNKMYRAEKGTPALVNTGLNAGTRYYSSHAKKTLRLKTLTVYVNGKPMEGMSPESLATLQRAQAVVASITNSSMTKKQKLRTCFEFVKTYQGMARPRIPNYTGMDWPVVYANDMFLNDGKGNCFSYAAAFAYMAKAIGYEEVYCCSSGGHGWAEIGGLIYDPERNKFDPSYGYFGFSYDTKTKVDYKGGIAANEPWMHVKI